MNLKLKKQQKGFTIIEVLIVLAIAGLIILIVFLAVPALQRNSRNTQRKNDASRVSALVSEHVSNNNGKLPTGVGTGTTEIELPDTGFAIVDKVDIDLMAKPSTGAGFPTALDKITIVTERQCKNNELDPAGGKRSYAITYRIETSGTPANQCI